MADLIKIDFPDRIKMQPVFLNRDRLEEIKENAVNRGTVRQVDRKYGELFFPEPGMDRPYIYGVLVLSVDGRMAFEDNPVGPYIARKNELDEDGGLLDYWTLMALRTHADGIITAAKTLTAEPEASLHICDEGLIRDRQERLGKRDRHPLNIVVSRKGQGIPYEHKLFNSLPDEDLVYLVVTSARGLETVKKESPRKVEAVQLAGAGDLDKLDSLKDILGKKDESLLPVLAVGREGPDLDTPLFMKALRTLGIKTLGIESPTYAYHLMEKKCLDEYFLNYSLLFAGGPIVPGFGQSFAHDSHPHTRLLSAHIHRENFLYTRHQLVYR